MLIPILPGFGETAVPDADDAHPGDFQMFASGGLLGRFSSERALLPYRLTHYYNGSVPGKKKSKSRSSPQAKRGQPAYLFQPSWV